MTLCAAETQMRTDSSVMLQDYNRALRRFCGHVEYYHEVKRARPEQAKVSSTLHCPCGKGPSLLVRMLHVGMLKGHLRRGWLSLGAGDCSVHLYAIVQSMYSCAAPC